MYQLMYQLLTQRAERALLGPLTVKVNPKKHPAGGCGLLRCCCHRRLPWCELQMDSLLDRRVPGSPSGVGHALRRPPGRLLWVAWVAARLPWRVRASTVQVRVDRHIETDCTRVECGCTSATRASVRSRRGLPASPWNPPSPPWYTNTCSPSVGCVAACAPAVGRSRLSLGI